MPEFDDFNYIPDESIFVYNKGPNSEYLRAYDYSTRNEDMKGCDPCNGFSSTYYTPCYATPGNECIGREYPQCQKTDPHCPQLEEYRPIKYTEIESDKESFSNRMERFVNKDLSENNIVLFIILICLIVVLLFDNKSKRKKNTFAVAFGPEQYGFPPLSALQGSL